MRGESPQRKKNSHPCPQDLVLDQDRNHFHQPVNQQRNATPDAETTDACHTALYNQAASRQVRGYRKKTCPTATVARAERHLACLLTCCRWHTTSQPTELALSYPFFSCPLLLLLKVSINSCNGTSFAGVFFLLWVLTRFSVQSKLHHLMEFFFWCCCNTSPTGQIRFLMAFERVF